MATTLECLDRIIAHLGREVKRWERLKKCTIAALTDAEVKARMSGHSMWDDPPAGYNEAKLLVWSRGYLWAEAVQASNAAAMIEAVIEVPDGLNDIRKRLA